MDDADASHDIDVVALAGELAKRLGAIVPQDFIVNVQGEAVWVLSDRRNGAARDLGSSIEDNPYLERPSDRRDSDTIARLLS